MEGWGLISLPMIPATLMSVSDFRNRQVSLLSTIAFLLCSALYSVLRNGLLDFLMMTICNLFLLVVFYVLLLAYFYIRDKKFCSIIDRAFGEGDVLFLVGVCFLLDYSEYCLFIGVSCLVGTIWARVRSSRDVPFIGLGAPVLLLFLTLTNIL